MSFSRTSVLAVQNNPGDALLLPSPFGCSVHTFADAHDSARTLYATDASEPRGFQVGDPGVKLMGQPLPNGLSKVTFNCPAECSTANLTQPVTVRSLVRGWRVRAAVTALVQEPGIRTSTTSTTHLESLDRRRA